MVENKFKILLQRLRCYNGGEYVSHDFKNFCKQKGLKVEYSIPRTREQNGIPERYNRTLLDKARCLIFEANMENDFWKEAISTSAYLTNRTPSSILSENKTPAELWYKQKRDLNKIKIFGCTSYVYIPAEDRKNKLDSRSQKMYLFGYTDNGYRLWNPIERKIIPARNVVFDEININSESRKEEIRVINYENQGNDYENNDENDKNNENDNSIKKNKITRYRMKILKDQKDTLRHLKDLRTTK